jgi:hypothetical protein
MTADASFLHLKLHHQKLQEYVFLRKAIKSPINTLDVCCHFIIDYSAGPQSYTETTHSSILASQVGYRSLYACMALQFVPISKKNVGRCSPNRNENVREIH